VAEEYYKTGKEPEGGTEQERAFLSALPVLPDRAKDLLIEKPHTWDEIVGTIDLCSHKQRRVWDWKTTGNLKYAKSKKALLKNPQFVIYGLAVSQAIDMRDDEQLTMTWIYVCRTPNQDGSHDVKPVEVETSPGELYKIYRDLFWHDIEQMKGAGEKNTPQEFDKAKDKKACYAYGRECPHMVACVKAEMEKDMSELKNSDLYAALMGDKKPEIKKEEEPQAVNPPEAAELADAEPAPAPKKKKKAAKKTKKKVTKKPVVAEDKPQPTRSGFTFYRHCLPAKGIEYVDVTQILAPICDKVAKDNDVIHWNLIQYAQGKSHIAALVRMAAEQGVFDGQHIVALGYSDAIQACEAELIEAAMHVVIGTK